MSQDVAALLAKGINDFCQLADREITSPLPRIFDMDDMDGRYNDEVLMELYGNPQRRSPLEPIEPGQFRQSFTKRWIPVSYGLGDLIAKEDWRDDRYAVFGKLLPSKGGALARAHRVLREIVAAQFFQILAFAANNATNVPTMSDGLSLFNTSHPASLANSSTLYSNRPSVETDLSNASYQVGASNIRQQYAANATEIRYNQPKTMVVNPNQGYLAKQILKGDWLANSSDRNQNYAKDDMIDLVEWAYFHTSGTNGATSTTPYNAWMLLGDEHYLRFYDRQEVEIECDYATNVQAFLFTSTARFVMGALDWRGTFGSTGS